MSSALVLGLAVPTTLALLAAGLWTDRRFSRFDELPAHYDFRGQPTRFASRRLMAWLVPLTLVFSLATMVLPLVALPIEIQKSNPVAGLLLVCAVLLGVQALICWLHLRWARHQP